MSKLQNVKAIKQMLDGNHRFQTRKTVGFSDARDTSKLREVGEIWEEKDFHGNSIWWEQRDGYRIKRGVHPDIANMMQDVRDHLNSFPNCQKETCTCIKPTTLDEKFRRMMGMCEDCLISMETKLKIQGKFNEYALQKMQSNAESFFKQADQEVEVLKREIKNIHFAGDENDINPVEKWSFQDEESYLKMIDEKYQDFKDKTMQRFKIGSNK